jgi:endonuclease/exonuclease/phosphatase (EEP) superfamily protein YafD
MRWVALVALVFLAGGLPTVEGARALEMKAVRTEPGPIRLLTFNVLGTNRNFDALSRYVDEVAPDIVVLQEASRPWLYETNLKLFPFRRHLRGLFIASRIPFAATEDARDPIRKQISRAFLRVPLAFPTASGTVRLALYNFHPRTPRQADGLEKREQDYRMLQAALAAEGPDKPIIVAGDFNAAPIEGLVQETFPVAGGFTILDGGSLAAPTRFARELGLSTDIGVPVDHVAVRGAVEGISRIVGPDLGSDHLPVVVEFRFVD